MRFPESKMRPFESRTVAVECGLRGSRKSSRGKAIIQRERKAGWPIIAIDPHDEHSVHGFERPGEVILGSLPMRLTWDGFWAARKDIIDLPDLGVAIIANGPAEETAEHLSDLADQLESTGGILVAFDELHRYAQAAQTTINRLAMESRKWRCPLLFITPRAKHIPADARTQVTDVESGTQRHELDMEALEDMGCGRDFAERVPLLPLGESIYWSDSHQLPPVRSESKRKRTS